MCQISVNVEYGGQSSILVAVINRCALSHPYYGKANMLCWDWLRVRPYANCMN